MNKIFSAFLVAATIFTTAPTVSAATNQFFQQQVGQWSVEGYYGDNNYCTVKTYWDNGSFISVFNTKNSNEISIYIYNTQWNIGDPSGTDPAYTSTIHFLSNKYGRTSGTISYELIDSQTVILRNINDNFLKDWIAYDAMEIVMPGDIGRIQVGLSGTKAILPVFADCIDKLNATNI